MRVYSQAGIELMLLSSRHNSVFLWHKHGPSGFAHEIRPTILILAMLTLAHPNLIDLSIVE